MRSGQRSWGERVGSGHGEQCGHTMPISWVSSLRPGPQGQGGADPGGEEEEATCLLGQCSVIGHGLP